jgi:hypothetical protein
MPAILTGMTFARIGGVNTQTISRDNRIGFRGLRPVIAYLESQPDKTHLIAVTEAGAVHNLIVTPKRSRQVVSDLRKAVGKSNGNARRVESLIQTL